MSHFNSLILFRKDIIGNSVYIEIISFRIIECASRCYICYGETCRENSVFEYCFHDLPSYLNIFLPL